MHIVFNKSKHGKKIYNSILLRESFRESGKVKKRTIANLSNCSKEEIEAIAFALKHKSNFKQLVNINKDVELQEGLSIGALWVVYQAARRLGIEKALTCSNEGKLALWQVIARVMDQGSRLSAVRLARVHAACEVLGIADGFTEDALYDNLAWMSDHQQEIETRLFHFRKGRSGCRLFLYDVTSSYLEGEKNFFGAYGYNRDKKRGKKQIVVGLLCDEAGDPVSVAVFSGNTSDLTTFAPQIQKIAQQFECKQVTVVGDRGMIKSAQIEQMPEGIHYITAITKPQIDSLIKGGVIQMGLFDERVCEVSSAGIRYILRRNPYRAEEVLQSRISKRQCVEGLVRQKNDYLESHPRASADAALKEVTQKIEKLKIGKWLNVQVKDRILVMDIDAPALAEESRLDGCYVIKTDLPEQSADTRTVHDRYCDLEMVEKAFRTCKTSHLEIRPVYVRNEKSTRGHVLVVMLAYVIVKYLQNAWKEFDLTVEEGLNQLSTLSVMEMKIKGKGSCLKIPQPREDSQKLLAALGIRMPRALPRAGVNVDTKTKLAKRLKSK
jgi:transposase